MSRIISIEYDDLQDEGLDAEVVELGSSDMSSVAYNVNKIREMEQEIAELQEHGNVRYDVSQELTSEQQAQARSNIGISAVSETDPVFTAWKNNTYPSDLGGKVDKVPGKGLSSNDYTNEEKNKLSNIASGAEVNVQADWNESDSSSDAYIKNKPTIPDVADYFDDAEYDSETKRINFKHGNTVKAYIDATNFVKDGMVSSVAISNGYLVVTFNTDAGLEPISIAITDIFNPTNYYDKTGVDTLLSGKADKVENPTTGNFASLDENGNLVDSGHKHSDYLTSETDPTVPAWAKESSKPSYTASEVGAIPTTAKGYANGVAELDENGKVPSSQMYSYVDDTIEGYLYNGGWYSDSSHTQSVTGETGKIYVELTTNKTYRWSGSGFVEISESLALGETSSTAYAGNKGKANAENIAAIQGLIPSTATTSNKLATASDIPTTYAGSATASGAANKAVSIPFGQVDSTSTSTAFTATVDGITELRDGVCVYLKNGVVTSATNCTLNVNGLGAKPMYNTMAATTAISTQWNVNYTMLFIYNSTRVSGGCWDMYYGYDSDLNTIGYQLRTNSYVLPVSDTSRYYKIFFTSADNTKYVPASADSTNNATSARPVNQRPINPFGSIVYLHGTSNYAEGTNVAAVAIWQQYNVTLGYSFNRTGAALTLTTSKPVFIKCAPQDDGSAIIDADVPYVQDLPTSEDGKIYIFLGVAYSATQVELQMVHPVYYYKNGSINLWTGTGVQTDVSKAESSNVIDIGEYDLMKINEVKGKSLVMNQLAANSFDGSTIGCTLTYDSTTHLYTLTATDNTNSQVRVFFYARINGIPNHKILVRACFKTFTFANTTVAAANVNTIYNYTKSKSLSPSISGGGTKPYAIYTIPSTWESSDSVRTYMNINNAAKFAHTTADTCTYYYNVFDLTQMFGEGNEPTTIEEFDALFPDDYYEYNTGEVVGNSVEKLDVYDTNDTKKGSLALNLSELTGKVGGEWNQLAKNPNPSTTNNTEWRAYNNSNVSIEYVDDGVKATILNEGYGYSRGLAVNCTGIANTHKYFAIITVKPSVTHDFNFEIGNGQAVVSSCTANQWNKVAGIVTSSRNDTLLLIVKPATSNLSVNDTFTVRFASCIDLTKMFGAGNEPASVEQCMMMFPNDYYPYNAGEVNSDISCIIFSDGLHGVGTAYDSLIVDEDGYARRAVKRIGSRAYASGDESDTSVITDNTNTYYPLTTPIEYVLDTPVQCVAKVYPNGTVKQVPVMPDSTPMVMDVTYLRDNALYATKEYVNDVVGDIETLLASI